MWPANRRRMSSKLGSRKCVRMESSSRRCSTCSTGHAWRGQMGGALICCTDPRVHINTQPALAGAEGKPHLWPPRDPSIYASFLLLCAWVLQNEGLGPRTVKKGKKNRHL